MVVEIFCNPSKDIAAKFGKKIKLAGGKYTDCRGKATIQFVTLPLTTECEGLIRAVIAAAGKTHHLTGPRAAHYTLIARDVLDGKGDEVVYVPPGAGDALDCFKANLVARGRIASRGLGARNE